MNGSSKNELNYKIDKEEFINIIEMIKKIDKMEDVLYSVNMWNENGNVISDCLDFLVDLLRKAVSDYYALDEIMSYLIPYWCFETEYGAEWNKNNEEIIEDGIPVDLSDAGKLWDFYARYKNKKANTTFN